MIPGNLTTSLRVERGCLQISHPGFHCRDRCLSPEFHYGLEKQITDQYAGLFAETFNLSLLGLRYFNVYGSRQDPRSPYAGVFY